MTARQGRIAVAVVVIVLTVLLIRAASATGEWTGLIITEVGMLVPLGIAWWIFGLPRRTTS